VKLDGLDPLLWASRPKSQQALDLLRVGAKDGDAQLAAILDKHVSDGVCNEAGKLLLRWDGVTWVSLVAGRYREAA
jgi:hypothetical protein